MLKRIALLYTLLLLLILPLLLTACGVKTPSPHGDIVPGEIVLTTQFKEYRPDTAIIEAVLRNGTEETLIFGANWSIEQKQGDGWYTLPFAQNTAWIELAYELPAGSTYIVTAHTASLASKLKPGDYRLVKVVDGTPVAAEFTVTEDAFAYAPIENLPKKYTPADAEADGVVMVRDTLSDAERVRAFFADRALGLDVQLRLGRETEDGLILTDIATNNRRLGCITVTTDASRAGGEITVRYFSHIISFNGDIFFTNTPTWKGILEGQTALMLSENAAGQAAYVIEPWHSASYPVRSSMFWSPDGMTCITLSEDGKKFGYSYYTDATSAGGGGHLLSIPAEYKMGKPIGAQWGQSEGKAYVVLICEGADHVQLSDCIAVHPYGYVFYDPETHAYTGYTHSQYHYQIDQHGQILIPE